MQKILECEIMKHSAKRIQIYLAIPVGLIFGYLLINMVNGAFDKRLFLGSLLIPMIVLFVLLIFAEIAVWYYTRGKLIIYQGDNNTFEFEFSFPNKEAEAIKGKWDGLGMYMKVYARYGMYTKHLGLALFCNDKPVGLLRHQLGGLASDPYGYRLVDQLYSPGGEQYWCKKTDEIYELIGRRL